MSESTFRYVVLTGVPGCGKTTLVKKVCNALKKKGISVSGFYTEEVRWARARIGFDVVSLDGSRAPLARTTEGRPVKQPTIGKYAVDLLSFESVIQPLVNSFNKKSILVLDEVGKMELLSNNFKEFVYKTIQDIKPVLLVTVPVRSRYTIPIVELIKSHPDSIVIEVDSVNLGNLETSVLQYLCNAHSKLLLNTE